MAVSLFRNSAQRNASHETGAHIAWARERFQFLSAGLCVLIVVALVCVAQITYAEKVSVSGHTVNAVQPVVVTAPVDGIVTQLRIASPAAVSQGQLLVRIEPARRGTNGLLEHRVRTQHLSGLIDQMNLQHDQAQDAHNAHLAMLAHQLTQLRLHQKALTRDLSLFKEVLALSRRHWLRAEQLSVQGVMTSLEAEQVARAWVGRQREQAKLEAQLQQASQEVVQLQLKAVFERKQFVAKQGAQRLQLTDLQHELKVNQQLSASDVPAPMPGVVDHISVHANATVRQGQELLTITRPGQQHHVELLVPSTSRSRLQVGQRVRMQYAGFPVQEYGMVSGIIEQISSAPVLTNAVTGVYKAVVRIDLIPPKLGDPPAGLQVKADIVIKHQTLWRWLVEPLRAALERM